MLSSVLNSEHAILGEHRDHSNIRSIATAIRTHEDLARRLEQLEWHQAEQEGRVQYVFETIQDLIEAPEEPKRRIGFPTAQLPQHK